MTDQPTDLPPGAIPTSADAPPHDEPADTEATMIDGGEVAAQIEEIESLADPRIGEPLPVGANDPDVVAATPPPPTMPGPIDDLDEEIATWHRAVTTDTSGVYTSGGLATRGDMRFDQVTLNEALCGRISPMATPRTAREVLLGLVANARAQRARAAREWSEAMRARDEARVLFEDAIAREEDAIQALRDAHLTIPGDDEGPTGPVASTVTISDADIV